MTLYFYAPGDAVPSEEPVELPQNWLHISSLDALEPNELAELGWKPAVDEIPNFDPLSETCRRTGWVVHKDRVTAQYQVEDKDLDQVRREAKARVANHRKQAEFAGIEIDGAWVDTSFEGQALFCAASQLVARYPDQIVDWKTTEGWIQMDIKRLADIGVAVGLHILACRTRERLLCELIDAAETARAVERAEVW